MVEQDHSVEWCLGLRVWIGRVLERQRDSSMVGRERWAKRFASDGTALKASEILISIREPIGEIMREVRVSGWREAVELEIDPEENRTKEQFGDEVNINTIMKKLQERGIVPEERGDVGHYGDFSEVIGYQDAMEAINVANESFARLSAEVRRRFNQDPDQLLAFIDDPGNEEEAIALGILPPPAPEKVDLVEPVPEVVEEVKEGD